MAITDLPTPPSRSAPSTFSTLADAFIAALPTFVTEANAQAAALTLNDTTDASSSSIAIGTGAKTFTVTASKSFQPGMWLVIADDAAPSTNQMFGSVTSYSGTTLVMNITSVLGSGTKSAWTISQSSPGGLFYGGDIGTPSAGVLTNCTGLPISTGVSGLAANVATFLATPSSVNLAAAITDETGTGAIVLATSPTLVTPALGTPSALVGTNITGTAAGLTAGAVTNLTVESASIVNQDLTTDATPTFSNTTLKGTTSTAVLGSELITNAVDQDFSGAGNWTGTNWTVGAGVFTHTAGANAASLANGNLDEAPVALSIYQIVFTAVTTTAGTLTPSFGGVNGVAIGQATGTLTDQTQVITATGTGALTFTPDATWEGTLDNISVKKITPSVAVGIIQNSNASVGVEIRSGGIGLDNTFSGYQSGQVNISGTNNTFSGYQSGYSNVNGPYNHFNGYQSGYLNTTGYSNHFNGYQSGYLNTTGYRNHFNGYQSGYANTTGTYNHFNGYQSGYLNTTGYRNHFNGVQSGYSNITGAYNHFNGYQSGYANTTGSSNTFNGYRSGYEIISGSNNTFNGYQSGQYITGGAVANETTGNSVFIGASTKAKADGDANEIVIGYNATGAGSNTVTLGNTSITTTLLQGNIGIGQSTFGTSAAKVIAFGSGTAPSTSPADAAQMWVEDAAAGQAILKARNETAESNGVVGVIETKTTTGDPAAGWEGRICINTFDNTVKMYADGGWRTMASGW